MLGFARWRAAHSSRSQKDQSGYSDVEGGCGTTWPVDLSYGGHTI